MSFSSISETGDMPTRAVYHEDEQRLDVYVDVLPATADDLSVWLDSSQIRIVVEQGETVWSGTVTPPSSRQSFADDGTSSMHNGILRVTVGLERRFR